jgi:signal transduction histidine kinase
VRCDPERTLRVLSNLVGNAVKFTSAGSVVHSVRSNAREAVITVQDSGRGISADLLPRLFERHRQAPETAQFGHGLGLFICKAIVEAQGGRIWAENRPESGAAVCFTLPRG